MKIAAPDVPQKDNVAEIGACIESTQQEAGREIAPAMHGPKAGLTLEGNKPKSGSAPDGLIKDRSEVRAEPSKAIS